MVFATLLACGGPARDIVGKWRTGAEPNDVVWEFASNGAVTIGKTRGRYSFGDSGRIKIETPTGASVYQAQITRDHMTFREASGSRLEFDRIK
jgi:hypothetical protein